MFVKFCVYSTDHLRLVLAIISKKNSECMSLEPLGLFHLVQVALPTITQFECRKSLCDEIPAQQAMLVEIRLISG